MRYYTIQNDGLLIAETRQALERFYNNVLELPEDYVEGKYIVVNGELVLNPDWDEERLRKAKQEKLKENETIREQFLISGIEYKDILWDSDLEQKLNLSIQVSDMSDEDVIRWLAKDGVTSLECTKTDLLAIGELLTKMTAYVWQFKNPMIKTAINNAETIEELDAIEIVYDLQELLANNSEDVTPTEEPEPTDNSYESEDEKLTEQETAEE